MTAQSARERLVKTRARMKLLAQLVGSNEPEAGATVASSEVLNQLGFGWHRIDDIRWPGKSFADVDHVLVGPGGIFVVDTRPVSKGLDLRPETVTANGWERPEVFNGLESAAHAIGSLLGMPHRRPIPILCLVGGDDIDTMVDSAIVCSIGHIVAKLQAMRPILGDRQVSDIADLLRTSLMPATGQFTAVPRQRGL
jgi:hypothetical protein